MTDAASNILIIGYGNPGRQDDGLGPALAEAVEGLGLTGVAVESDYQLTVEHAEMASHHRVVVFADATTQRQEAFTWDQVTPGETGIRFSSHHLEPSEVLALARDLFDADPSGYVLAMRGSQFGEFEAGLSTEARAVLESAVEFLTGKIRDMMGVVSYER